MSKISRRSFLTVSAAAASGSFVLGFAKATENIPSFDQTKTDYGKKQRSIATIIISYSMNSWSV